MIGGGAVPVADIVLGAQSEAGVVVSGADDVACRGVQAVGQLDLQACRVVGSGEAIVAGAVVEVVHDVVGRGEDHRVSVCRPVGSPPGVGGVVDGGGASGMDPAVVEVVPEPGGVTVTQQQARGGFGGVGEPHDVAQRERTGRFDHVGGGAAGVDGGELFVVADTPHRCAAGEQEGQGA